jgi:hypothetical protein
VGRPYKNAKKATPYFEAQRRRGVFMTVHVPSMQDQNQGTPYFRLHICPYLPFAGGHVVFFLRSWTAVA